MATLKVKKDGKWIAAEDPTTKAYVDEKLKPKEYELIGTYTVTADTDGALPNKVGMSLDSEGNSFELTEFYIKCKCSITTGAIRAEVNGNKAFFGNITVGSLANQPALRTWALSYRSYGEDMGGCVSFPNTSVANTTAFPNGNIYQWNTVIVLPNLTKSDTYAYNSIKSIYLSCVTGTATWLEGSTFELWGVRKK